jgi:hypothetical protein
MTPNVVFCLGALGDLATRPFVAGCLAADTLRGSSSDDGLIWLGRFFLLLSLEDDNSKTTNEQTESSSTRPDPLFSFLFGDNDESDGSGMAWRFGHFGAPCAGIKVFTTFREYANSNPMLTLDKTNSS